MTNMGADRETSMQCPQCGKRYPSSFAYCPDDASDLIAPSDASAASSTPGKRIDARVLGLCGVSLLAVIVVVGFLLAHRNRAAAVAASGSTSSPGPETADPPEGDGGPTPPSLPPPDMTWDRYSSDLLAFQVDHPHGWQMAGPVTKGGTTAISFSSPDGKERILVDVDDEAPPSVTPRRRFEAIDRFLRKKNGDRYQAQAAEDLTLNGRPAISWVFTVRQDDGTSLETRDIAVPHTGNGRSYAVLCTAPTADYEAWHSVFDKVTGGFYFEN